jgi:hypothetical protein
MKTMLTASMKSWPLPPWERTGTPMLLWVPHVHPIYVVHGEDEEAAMGVLISMRER